MEWPESYTLEKWIWTEADFDTMHWHDASVYRWRLGQDLILDIDYIFQWNTPEVEGTSFTFWVSPATLVFHSVSEVEFDFDFVGIGTDKLDAAEIDSIEKESREWTIQFQHGYIAFKANGFTQYIRKAPSFEFGQQVSFPHRGGTSLETVTGEHEPESFDLSKFRKTENWRHYQIMLERARVKHQLDLLLNERAEGKIDIKAFLIRKRDFQDRINYLGIELRDTMFYNH